MASENITLKGPAYVGDISVDVTVETFRSLRGQYRPTTSKI